jgi:hypothetical protein
MRQSIPSFLLSLILFILIVFFVFWGYQISPFQSLAWDFALLGALTISSAFFLGRGIWLIIEEIME